MHCNGHVRKHRRTLSERSGLQFSVARVHRDLKDGFYSQRVGIAACVYMAAVMEYLSAEVLEVAGKVTLRSKRARITPVHILSSVQLDTDLTQLFQSVTIREAGVIPKLQNSPSRLTVSWERTK